MIKILISDRIINCKKTSLLFPLSTDNFTIHADVYSFEEEDIKPFFAFCDRTICAFVHKSQVNSLTLDMFSDSEQNSLSFYVYFIESNGLVGDFEKFKFNNKLFNINWIPNRAFKYKFEKNTLNIWYKPKTNKTYWITQILEKLNGKMIAKEIAFKAKQMQLIDRIEHIYFADCLEYNFLSKYNAFLPNPPLVPCVLATNYSTNKKDRFVLDRNMSNISCCLIFSPIIFYFNKNNRTKLITHELSHIFAGNIHCHDSFFWFIFEKFSGFKRQDDFAYNSDQEKNDTDAYNSEHPFHGTNYLIHKYERKIK